VPEKKDGLAKIVGEKNIFDDEKTLETYSRDNSFVQPRKPSLVVKPKSADEVHEVVKWANETGTPLVPASSGKPRFYGDTVPSVGGAVVVDLSGLKKIIRIHRRTRMAMIEPGVTYGELQPELAKNDLRLSTPLLPRANKSVVASLLERQPTLVPKYQWTLLEPLRCLGVVWGNGDKSMTGDAGMSMASLEEQWKLGASQMQAMGPGTMDYHRLMSGAQGSMGIATWASVKCEILPQIHKLFFIPASRLEDLIECAYRILRVRLGDEFLLLNSSDLATILGEGAEQIRALRSELPPWVIIMGIAGRDLFPEEKVDFQGKDTRDIVQQFGLELLPAVSGIGGGQIMSTILNPSPVPYWKLSYSVTDIPMFVQWGLNLCLRLR
jgi:FAD/FMN-containing dehydrogenase